MRRGRIRLGLAAFAATALVSIALAPVAGADSCSDRGPVTRPLAPNPDGLPASEVAMLSYEGAVCSCSPQRIWHEGMHPQVAASLRAAMSAKEQQAIRDHANFGVPEDRVPVADRVIWIRNAVRTYDEQRCLRARLGRVAAVPGYSTHEFGIAVDLEDWEHGPDGALLVAHGWCRTVPSEPWHYEHRASLEFFGLLGRCIK